MDNITLALNTKDRLSGTSSDCRVHGGNHLHLSFAPGYYEVKTHSSALAVSKLDAVSFYLNTTTGTAVDNSSATIASRGYILINPPGIAADHSNRFFYTLPPPSNQLRVKFELFVAAEATYGGFCGLYLYPSAAHSGATFDTDTAWKLGIDADYFTGLFKVVYGKDAAASSFTVPSQLGKWVTFELTWDGVNRFQFTAYSDAGAVLMPTQLLVDTAALAAFSTRPLQAVFVGSTTGGFEGGEKRLRNVRISPKRNPVTPLAPTLAYSTRALNGYTGAVVRLERSTDLVQADFFSVGDYGTLLVNSTLQTPEQWLGAATGFVHTFYDQSGGGRHATGLAVGTGTKPFILKVDGEYIVRFIGGSSANGGFFNIGATTWNVSSNGGFTAVSRVNMRASDWIERIYDIGTVPGTTNLACGRFGNDSRVAFVYGGQSLGTPVGTLKNQMQTIVNNIRGSGTSWTLSTWIDLALTRETRTATFGDLSAPNTYIGRNWESSGSYATMDLADLLFYNRSLPDADIASTSAEMQPVPNADSGAPVQLALKSDTFIQSASHNTGTRLQSTTLSRLQPILNTPDDVWYATNPRYKVVVERPDVKNPIGLRLVEETSQGSGCMMRVICSTR